MQHVLAILARLSRNAKNPSHLARLVERGRYNSSFLPTPVLRHSLIFLQKFGVDPPETRYVAPLWGSINFIYALGLQVSESTDTEGER